MNDDNRAAPSPHGPPDEAEWARASSPLAARLLQLGAAICEAATDNVVRERASIELDELLVSARARGFGDANVLRDKLLGGIRTKRTYQLAELAATALASRATRTQ